MGTAPCKDFALVFFRRKNVGAIARSSAWNGNVREPDTPGNADGGEKKTNSQQHENKGERKP